ncbi:T9SS type A sorting domain-containing protein [Winogradskyella litoriviva]|uniref:T9SS type A sorting domain-containing protein n=1 Tax=Winogradskyella litoriviva TaxID=1220182 RepID=A0ABX2E4I3_9FLAO|nr:T9SS type A sorting domain-containing protein [Winogradskyella litoriviva]NRD23199.1 T9SS type A sorting domain-containing protein [Winogradskyella litoriviva]
MKKKLLFMSLFLASLVSYAQFEVRDQSDDSLLSEGQVIAFSEAGCAYNDPCNFKFKVTNTSTTDIYMRIFVDNLTGTDGSNFQLCFNGVCLNNVSLNSGYPSTPALIAAGTTNSAGNNFWNQNSSDTTTPMSWTLRFQAYDASGFTVGTPLTVTYEFNPSLSVDETELSFLEVYPTSTQNHLNVISSEDLSADIFDLVGRKVMQANITSGTDTIDVSNLSAQPYIIRFTNTSGNTMTKKIVKK